MELYIVIHTLGIGLFCSLGLCALYFYKKEMDKVAVRVRQTQMKRPNNTHETLVQDPVTGIYSVKR